MLYHPLLKKKKGGYQATERRVGDLLKRRNTNGASDKPRYLGRVLTSPTPRQLGAGTLGLFIAVPFSPQGGDRRDPDHSLPTIFERPRGRRRLSYTGTTPCNRLPPRKRRRASCLSHHTLGRSSFRVRRRGSSCLTQAFHGPTMHMPISNERWRISCVTRWRSKVGFSITDSGSRG